MRVVSKTKKIAPLMTACLAAFIAAAVLTNCGGGGTLADSRDGKTYRAVKIGDLTWMAENLNHATADSWCYDLDDANCETYGRLYPWNTALTVCPAGWRLPTDDDWDDLMIAVNSVLRVDDEGSVSWEGAGTRLKSQSGWEPFDGTPAGTNNFGFSALPGGGRWDGTFYSLGNFGLWWTATEHDELNARYRKIYHDYEDVNSHWDNKINGLSVRCVK